MSILFEECTRRQKPVMATSLREFLGSVIDDLPDQERLVLTLYHYEKVTMSEIAAILKMTESRIYQIHTQAIRELSTKLQSVGAFA